MGEAIDTAKIDIEEFKSRRCMIPYSKKVLLGKHI